MAKYIHTQWLSSSLFAVEVDKDEEPAEELVAGSPVDNEFISDAFQEGHYDEEDLKKEMQQLGMDDADGAGGSEWRGFTI